MKDNRATIGEWGVDLTASDPSVSPEQDFFRYVNGAWYDQFIIPDDKPRAGVFDDLVDNAERQVHALLEELVVDDASLKDEEQKKVAELYRSFMNEEAIEREGLKALSASFDAISAIHSEKELLEAFSLSASRLTYGAVAWTVSADPKEPLQQRLTVSHGNLSLPDRDYYLSDDPQFKAVRTQYLAHLQEVLAFLPQFSEDPAEDARAVLALETRMAEVHWTPAEMRDIDRTHNPMSIKELSTRYRSIDWHLFLEALHISDDTECNVFAPEPLSHIIEIVHTTPIHHWKLLLVYRLLVNVRHGLPATLRASMFHLYDKVLLGRPEMPARWKVAVAFMNRSLGDAVGKLYVSRHFPPTAKVHIDSLVKNLRAVFAMHIAQAEWMEPETRDTALSKLNSFTAMIGYPDTWRDYSALTIESCGLVENMLALGRFSTAEAIAELQAPTDTQRWFMPPQTVNAYYHPLFNQIVFPAAILQAPFFDPNADAAVNYGGIGAVIGHEMGHGFDDQGRKFDQKGQLNNWWTKTDVENFSAATRKLVEQFNEYERLPGMQVNGQLTLGENIGDLGGITLAYSAYCHYLGGEEPPVIDGYTGKQRFFLGYAQLWRIKERDEFAQMLLKADPHSPPMFRVNGALRNVDAWYDAFNVGPQSEWYLPPSDRVKVW